MSLTAFNIPDDSTKIAAWLEDVLATGDLRSLVAQLSSLENCKSNGIRELLGNKLGVVLQHGLSALDESELRLLLASPVSLLELQESVMVDGGEYWKAKFAGSTSTVERTRQHIESLARTVSSAKNSKTAQRKSTFAVPVSVLALAATILLVVIGLRWWGGDDGGPELAKGWGWMNAKELPSDLSASKYLEALSEGAAAWSKKRPQNAEELAQRLSEFKAGCEILIAADHKPLSEADRSWLLYECRGWRTKLVSLLAASREDKFAETLEKSDALAGEIAGELAKRSQNVSG